MFVCLSSLVCVNVEFCVCCFFYTCVMCFCVLLFFFFFFKQKTAYEMRISDWSSDVCSSDLLCAFDDLRQLFLRCAALGSCGDALINGQLELREPGIGPVLLRRVFLELRGKA